MYSLFPSSIIKEHSTKSTSRVQADKVSSVYIPIVKQACLTMGML